MPWAWGAYSACCISAASALTPTGRACCLSQYCMTIAMLAAPQPSFSCFTNGTLSQMPEAPAARSEEHTSELQSQFHLVCRLLLEKKKTKSTHQYTKHPQR